MRRILHLGLGAAIIMVFALIGSPQRADGAVSDGAVSTCEEGGGGGLCDTWDPDIICIDYRATFVDACVSGHTFCDGVPTGPN
jgi:hypothetical protein